VVWLSDMRRLSTWKSMRTHSQNLCQLKSTNASMCGDQSWSKMVNALVRSAKLEAFA
jgi:hypothetical protein